MAKKNVTVEALDIIGRPLKEGDYVVFQTPGSCKGMDIGQINKINPKTATVHYNFGQTTFGKYDDDLEKWTDVPYSTTRAFKELVKMDGQEFLVYLLKKQ